ncbi:MAG TPA: hypothetical protein VIK08_04180 [Candidatus Limnocylindrales bacterium]
MTATRDPDHIIGLWLDQMPDRVSDRVIGTVLQAVETTPQVRRIFVRGSRRYEQMNRFVFIAATIALGVVLVGGAAFLTGGSTSPTPGPTASQTATQAAISSAPSVPPTASGAGLGGPVPAALQARWMGSNRSFTDLGAGISLLFGQSSYTIAQANSNQSPYALGVVGSSGQGDLRFGASPTYDCPNAGIGQYGWQLSPSGRVLTITLTSDDCAQRAGDVPGTYWLMGCNNQGTNCLGELDPGTYSSQYLRPLPVQPWRPLFGGVTYTVPAGWANYSDWPNTVGLTTTDEFANTTRSNPEPAAGVDVLTNASALAAPCSLALSTSQASANDLLVDLGGNIVVTQPTAVTIDGYSGGYVDITATAEPAPSGAGRSPTYCGTDVPYLYAAGDAQSIPVGQKQRLVLLDLPDGNLVAVIVWADSSQFDALVTAAMPVIQSMTFN